MTKSLTLGSLITQKKVFSERSHSSRKSTQFLTTTTTKKIKRLKLIWSGDFKLTTKSKPAIRIKKQKKAQKVNKFTKNNKKDKRKKTTIYSLRPGSTNGIF